MIIIKNNTLKKILNVIIPFSLIPLIIILGNFLVDEKKHLFISLAVAVLSLLFFISGIEKKNLGTRRLVIVSIMSALCIIGRFIPFFQPFSALIIISALYLGKESGFLVGAVSAFLSNFYFGQGPWTPFQMFAWGAIGLFAGYLSVPLKKNKLLLLSYGIISGVLFSLIMDLWTTIWMNGYFNLDFYKASIITSIPYTFLYSFSNFVFLLICAKPFGKKFSRINIKYGI